MNKIKTATWNDLTKPSKRRPRPKPQPKQAQALEDFVAGVK